jgi:hypothetical protein
MSKKARIAKKIRRLLMREFRKAHLDEQLQKAFEDFLIYGEIWYPHPPSVAELTARNVSLVKSSVELSTLIRERFTSTKMLQNNVLDLVNTKNEANSSKLKQQG